MAHFISFCIPDWPVRVTVSIVTAEIQLADALCVVFVGLVCVCV